MKTAPIISTALIALFVIMLLVIIVMSKVGKAAGLTGGILSQCPDKPNCVCSEDTHDGRHSITPLAFPQKTPVHIVTLLKQSIEEMGGDLQQENENYLAAEFTSKLLRFVDDLEIRIDQSEKVIHIRSASRVGYSDLGVNRKRVELLKDIFRRNVLKVGGRMEDS
ncbi:MAG: DUF1499 domain-containing protein [Sedimenticola sp.]|nr:DUF1499 domain-containing protein [Sedimenticola sp.]